MIDGMIVTFRSIKSKPPRDLGQADLESLAGVGVLRAGLSRIRE